MCLYMLSTSVLEVPIGRNKQDKNRILTLTTRTTYIVSRIVVCTVEMENLPASTHQVFSREVVAM